MPNPLREHENLARRLLGQLPNPAQDLAIPVVAAEHISQKPRHDDLPPPIHRRVMIGLILRVHEDTLNLHGRVRLASLLPIDRLAEKPGEDLRHSVLARGSGREPQHTLGLNTLQSLGEVLGAEVVALIKYSKSEPLKVRGAEVPSDNRLNQRDTAVILDFLCHRLLIISWNGLLQTGKKLLLCAADLEPQLLQLRLHFRNRGVLLHGLINVANLFTILLNDSNTDAWQ